MHRSDRRSALLVCALLAACQGEGSDIGPKLAALPNASCKVVVLDDTGRGVVAARASVGGAQALTGRNGRGDLLANPRGRLLVTVDGQHAAAVAGDRLGSMRFAATITGPDLPAVVFLPELPDSSAATLPLGTQAATTIVTAPAGERLTVAAGVSIGSDDAAATTVTLRVGSLQAQHVPGDLPTAGVGALLTGRVVCIDPPGATLVPAADLDVADDLGLGASGTATLFRLDPATGEWGAVQSGLFAVAGRIQAPAAVAGGGCFLFGAEVQAATLGGRVVAADGRVVPDVMVTVDGRATRTDSGGRFAIDTVPGALADGSPRNAVVELCAGGSWLPVRLGQNFAITPGATLDVGDLVLETMPAGNVRVQQIRRGRAEVLQRVRLASTCDAVALATFGDESGQALLEDLPAEWFGFQIGRPIDGRDVFYGQGVGFLDRGRRWFDNYQFLDERPWFIGTRRTRALVTDAIGAGALCDVALVRGAVPGSGFVALSNESGSFFVDRDFSGRATASLRSQRDGVTVVHAITIERPDGDKLELPIRRVLRQPMGAFDRHGLIAGTLLGADPAREHRLRATRRLDLQEWWDDAVEDIALQSSLPIDLDPATTHGAFQAGVGLPAGHLVAAELTAPGGMPTLQALAVAADVRPVEGATTARDLPLDLPATQSFAVSGALAGAPGELDLAQMTLDLALRQPSGRVVDVVRGLRGNHAAAAPDLTFTLPALAGTLQDHTWLALLQGTFASGGATLASSSLIELPRPAAQGAWQFQPFPQVSAPAPGAAVAAGGFTVDYTLPAEAVFGTIELRSETAGETFLWQVFVPKDQTRFEFVALPTEAATPLVAGRTYTLTVTAWFGFDVLATSSDPYRDLSTFVQSLGPTTLGLEQVTRRSITVTAN